MRKNKTVKYYSSFLVASINELPGRKMVLVVTCHKHRRSLKWIYTKHLIQYFPIPEQNTKRTVSMNTNSQSAGASMTPDTQAQKSRTHSQEILSGCRSLVVGFCETQSDAFIAGATQQLFEQADHIRDNNEQRRLFEASQYLDKNAANLPRVLGTTVKQRFDKVFSASSTQHTNPDNTREQPQELSLVKTDEMEIEIAIKGMASRVEASYSEELFGITQRMAMLNQGIKLDENSAPYNAKFLSETFFGFIAGANQEQAIQLIMLKLFERNFLTGLGELYQEMNRYLISSNVLPNLRYRKTRESGQPLRRRKSDKLAAESEQRQAELYQALESVLGSSTTPIDPDQPMLSTEQALYDLLMLQKSPVSNLLEQASNPTLPNTNSAALQTTLECVSLLFDIVSNDNSLGTPVKNLFSHLQTPYARMALADPTFLSDPQHDARKLMQALVQAGEQWTDRDTEPANEVVQRIKTIVEKIVSDVNDVQQLDAGMFRELLNEFTQFIESFEKKIKLTEQRSVQAAEGREKLKENQLKVEVLIEQKIGNETLPKPIESLIREVWSSYMTYILLRHGEDNPNWEAAISAIDSLLWYIEPKLDTSEREKATEVKEALDAVLTRGMQSVGLDSADIKQRLHSLDLCLTLATENAGHADTTNVRPPSGTSADLATPASTASTAKNCIDPEIRQDSEEPPVSPVNDEAIEPASSRPPAKSRIQQQQDALKRRNETPGEVSELEQSMKQAAGSASRRASKFDLERVLSMKFGTHLSWRPKGEEPHEIKLTWYNTRTRNCMLSNRAGKELGMVSANTIAVGIADGWIKELDQSPKKPLFERMLETITKRSRQTA